jgi:hypothetical protein
MIQYDIFDINIIYSISYIRYDSRFGLRNIIFKCLYENNTSAFLASANVNMCYDLPPASNTTTDSNEFGKENHDSRNNNNNKRKKMRSSSVHHQQQQLPSRLAIVPLLFLFSILTALTISFYLFLCFALLLHSLPFENIGYSRC